MNYIKLQKGFSKHCKIYFIPALARLLWHDLVDLFNELEWPEWIQISNERLMSGLQIKREGTFIEIRNKLIEQKLFIYEKGLKGKPSRYKFNCDIGFINDAFFESQNRNKSVVQTEVQGVVQTVDINKLIHYNFSCHEILIK